jgi:hypothetical protein
MCLAPLVLLNLTLAARQLVQTSRAATEVAKPAKIAGGPQLTSRVVWIIFDEMDYRAAFGERLPSVALPEFDRLRGQSLFATHAFPPAGMTIPSLTSLITGKTALAFKITSPSELMLTIAGASEQIRLSTQPNVFARTRSLGGRTGLVGWCIPYSRIIGGDLDKCLWPSSEPARIFNSAFGASMLDLMWKTGKETGTHIPVLRVALNKLGLTQDDWRVSHLEMWRQIQQKAIAAVTDPNLSLTLIHHCVPHPPSIFDRKRKDFSVSANGAYFGNLELADRTLGELRRVMEQTGLWDKTTVLVSSDHWFRFRGSHSCADEVSFFAGKLDHRVPFILKLAGTSAGVVYSKRFNTVITHDLLLAILHGDIRDTQDLAPWIDRHKTDPPAEYSDPSGQPLPPSSATLK